MIVYDFLDPRVEHAKLAAYIIGIAVATILVFILVRYICQFRSYLFIRAAKSQAKEPTDSFQTESKQEIAGNVEAFEEWEEVHRPRMSTASIEAVPRETGLV